jgi:hypothetical protein
MRSRACLPYPNRAMLDSRVNNVPLCHCGSEGLILRCTWVGLLHVLCQVKSLVLGMHICRDFGLLLGAAAQFGHTTRKLADLRMKHGVLVAHGTGATAEGAVQLTSRAAQGVYSQCTGKAAVLVGRIVPQAAGLG